MLSWQEVGSWGRGEGWRVGDGLGGPCPGLAMISVSGRGLINHAAPPPPSDGQNEGDGIS